MATLYTRVVTALRGEMVGTDAFGNRYYRSRNARSVASERRWVVYKGIDEASKVPADWFGWLHKSEAEPPRPQPEWNWQKPHLPNLSGTRYAYRPSGHLLEGGRRQRATGDYEAWNPGDSQ